MFGDSRNAELTIAGMNCRRCQAKANQALQSVRGVKSAAVDLQTGRATVVFNSKKTDLDALSRAVSGAGFAVAETKMY